MDAARANNAIATGLPGIDSALGGILEPGIVEIIGRSGVGKSQLAMTLSARFIAQGALAAGPSSVSPHGVVFIDTEGKFPPRRCLEIALGFSRDELSRGAIQAAMSAQLVCLRAKDSTGLRHIVDGLESVMARVRARLVVVDSIAALIRRDFDTSGLRERQAHLSSIAAKLKQLADAYGAVVLVTNQVSGVLGEGEGGALPSGMVRPALGMTWSHCVNTRLVLEMTKLEVDAPGDAAFLGAAPSSSDLTASSEPSAILQPQTHPPSSVLGAGREADSAAAARDAARLGGVRSITIAKSPVAAHAVDHFVVCAAGTVPLPPGDRLRLATHASSNPFTGVLAGTSAFAAAQAAAGFPSDDERPIHDGIAPPARAPAAPDEDEDAFAGLTEAELAALEAACQ